MEFPREEGFCKIVELLESDVGDINLTNYCLANNIILVKGDVVSVKYNDPRFVKFEETNYYVDNIMYIFNGEVLEKPHYVDPISANLPRAFSVIENNVPTNYWSNTTFRDFVWFNHNNYKEELLQNIQYNVINDQYCIYTTFNYNNKQYRIIFDYISRFMIDNDECLTEIVYHQKEYDDIFDENFAFKNEDDLNKYRKLFIEILSNGKELTFSSSSDDYDICDGYTLFITDYIK